MKVKSLSKCPTLHNPMDCSLPGSSVPGIYQASVLEWVAIALSRYIQLIHIAVQQKLTEHCKVKILWYKLINKVKND